MAKQKQKQTLYYGQRTDNQTNGIKLKTPETHSYLLSTHYLQRGQDHSIGKYFYFFFLLKMLVGHIKKNESYHIEVKLE